MTKDMTKLVQHIDEMRARLNQTAHSERSLVESLGDALNRLDQDILQSIRNIATGHEARRGAIRNELQALACSIGMFLPPHEVVVLPQPIDGYPSAPTGGDWRQATMNLSYHEEFERHLNGQNSHH